MPLIQEFKNDLYKALENYKQYYVKNNIAMTKERKNEILKFTQIYNSVTNVLDMREAFIQQYNAMKLPLIAELFSFLDNSLLRSNLKSILYDEKYSVKKLESAYLRELIQENTKRHSPTEEDKILLEKVHRLEEELVNMRDEKILLEKTNEKLKKRNIRLKSLLQKNNIPYEASSDEENELPERCSSQKIFDELKEVLEEPDLPDSDQLKSAINDASLREDVNFLKKELTESKLLIRQLQGHVTVLQNSKDKLYQENLKLLRDQLASEESKNKNVEPQPKINASSYSSRMPKFFTRNY